ncbi:hypothetical protein LB505_008044 [Fusarium chuoi]|nr:hypothetical protein LB505_008044 [Fusarium chuoi]
MKSVSYVIDPEGDIELVLNKPNTQNIMPEPVFYGDAGAASDSPTLDSQKRLQMLCGCVSLQSTSRLPPRFSALCFKAHGLRPPPHLLLEGALVKLRPLTGTPRRLPSCLIQYTAAFARSPKISTSFF